MNEKDQTYLINEIENLIKVRNLILEKQNNLFELKTKFDKNTLVYKDSKYETSKNLKSDLQEMRNYKSLCDSGLNYKK